MAGRQEPDLDSSLDAAKYAGFKVRWDPQIRTFVFESQEERDRWQVHRYGRVRNAFRTPDEPTDERPCLKDCNCAACREHHGFWRNPSEREAFETAAGQVMAMPDFERLPLEQRLRLIAAGAGATPGDRRARSPVLRSITPVRPLGEDEFNRRVALLRGQARQIEQREPGSEG